MIRNKLFSLLFIFSLAISLVVPTGFVLADPTSEMWQEIVLAAEPENLGWQRMSPWYQAVENSDATSTIKISYYFPSDNLRQIFSYNEESKKWQAINGQDNRGIGVVSANVVPSGKFALFIKSGTLSFGSASWYRYKNGLFAASPDFPKGTSLKVTNLENNKSVVVVVNDFGPDRSKHPDRVIDLDLVAFEKIAKKSAGLIEVRVEQAGAVEVVKAVPVVNSGKTLVVSQTKKDTVKPEIVASAAIAIWEKSGDAVYEKNSLEKLPPASLTKIVAVKVFLDTKTSLSKVVTYKKADEDFNNKYCSPWESAKLTVKEGETMTVENLLYASLVGSANNSVESLVRASGLKRAVFIDNMNSLVKKWGAKNTKFVEPTGLSPDNVSSAADYAIITKEALKDSTLQKIDTAKTYSFKTINTKKVHNLKNTSSLLRDDFYEVTASKTGYLDEAGHCLMSRVKIGADNLIIVVFGAKSSSSSVEATKNIINYATGK